MLETSRYIYEYVGSSCRRLCSKETRFYPFLIRMKVKNYFLEITNFKCTFLTFLTHDKILNLTDKTGLSFDINSSAKS